MRRRKYIQLNYNIKNRNTYNTKNLKILYITNNPLTQKDVLLEKSVLKELETETYQKINTAAQKVSCNGFLETDQQKTFRHC